ncbi:uncharacterized protein BDW70DRAFT_159724 [Aspergillus foveolatus]|uniref:uncharacterized protein n=1 Tax=Aspergillus foveolatus TaxID=210207 RepID=UPI003CCE1C37
MKFAAALAIVFLFGTTHAIPNPPAQAQEPEQQRVRFLVPNDLTVEQGSSKRGGSGADGLGLFSQCSKLDVERECTLAIPITAAL